MGLNALQKLREMQEKSSGNGGTRFLKLKDGDRVRIRLLQELDEDAKNYSEQNGHAVIFTEHQPADKLGYLRKFQCTLDAEGQCYGCEQAQNEDKKWKGKGALYVNVLVDDGKDDPYVAVMRQGIYAKNDPLNQLLEFAEDYETLTNREFKMSRKGSGMQDTTYTLTGMDPSNHDVEQYELFDLSSIIKYVPYEEQEEYSTPDEDEAKPKEKGKELKSEDLAEEW